MKSLKRFVSVILMVMLLSMFSMVPVYAATVYHFDFNAGTTPSGWTLGSGAVVNRQFELTSAPNTTFSVYKAPSPYLGGQVIIEYDFNSTSDKSNFYVQNPNGGSVLRLQQILDGKTIQVQYSNDVPANDSSVITTAFVPGAWYHLKYLIDYTTTTEKPRATASVYLYNASGTLVGSVENKIYMDAARYTTPADLRIFQMQNIGTNSGISIFDNISVYQNTDESSVDATSEMLKINDGAAVSANVTLPTTGLNGTSISWASSNPSVMTNSGVVTVPSVQTTVTMTATIQKGSITRTKTINVDVMPASQTPVVANVYYYNFDDSVTPTWLETKSTQGFNGVRNGKIELDRTVDAGTTITVAPEVAFNLSNMVYGTFSGKVITEFSFTSNADKANIIYLQATPNSGSLIRLEQLTATSMRLTTGGTGTTAVNTTTSLAFEQNKTYRVKMIADYDNTLCSLYIEGNAVAENHHFMTSTSPGYLRNLLLQHNGTTGKVSYDNFAIYHNDVDSAVVVTQKALELDTATNIEGGIDLPTVGLNGTTISWTSSNTDILSDDGEVVYRPETNTPVTLTAVIAKEGRALSKTFVVNVARTLNDTESVAADKNALVIPSVVTDNIMLMTVGSNGTAITWTSSNPLILSNAGVVNRPAATENDQTVTLTANLAKNSVTDTVEFLVTVSKYPYIRKYDFSAGTANWTMKYRPSGTPYTNAIVTEGENSYISLVNAAGANDIIESALNVGSIVGNVVVEMQFKATTDEANVLFVQNPVGGSAARIVLLDGTLIAQSSVDGVFTSTRLLREFQKNQWYDLRLELDYSSKEFNVYVNDVLKAKNLAFITQAERFEVMLSQILPLTEAATEDVALSMDNVLVYQATDSTAVRSDASMLDFSEVITRDMELSTFGGNGSVVVWESSDETIISPDGVVNRPDFSEGDRTVTLTATATKNGFSHSKAYTVIVMAKNNYVDIVNKQISSSQNTVGITLDLINKTAQAQDITLALATYANGKLIDVDYKVISLEILGSNSGVTLSADQSAEGTYQMLLWDSVMSPIG